MSSELREKIKRSELGEVNENQLQKLRFVFSKHEGLKREENSISG